MTRRLIVWALLLAGITGYSPQPRAWWQSVQQTSISGGVWSTLVDPALNADDAGWITFTMRMLFSTGAYDAGAPATATKVRVTFAASSIADAVIGSTYWGVQAGSGAAYDFDGTQQQLLFAGSGSKTVTANTTALSDVLDISAAPFDKTKKYVVSIYFNGVTAVRKNASLANYDMYYTAGDSASSTTPPGNTQLASQAFFIDLIEVFN